MKLQCGSRILDLSEVRVMGIINATPDSFSDGGAFASVDAALFQAEKMLKEGADILDIGGESTRPGAQSVSVQEELARVLPVVEAVASRLDVLISVDTSTAQVMQEAARAGVHLLNDVRSFTREGALAAALASGLPLCVMHMNGEPQVMQQSPHYDQPVEEAVLAQLQASVERCVKAGVARTQILIDPGFGFGKNTQHDYRLLNRLERLQDLQLPVLTGLSRKRMIGAATGQTQASQRIIGSAAAAVLCAQKGSNIVRVHDVKETVQALAVFKAMKKEGYV